MTQALDGFVDIIDQAGVPDKPNLTLTDTAPGKSLKIDVNNNIAQIRELAGAANSLMSFDLNVNHIGVFSVPKDWGSFAIAKDIFTLDPNWFFFVLSSVQEREA